MKDRIKELWDKSKSSGVHPTFGEYDMYSAEKFAELIVKECSKVIVNGGYRNPAFGEKHPLTPPEIAKMIKQHFGVEE